MYQDLDIDFKISDLKHIIATYYVMSVFFCGVEWEVEDASVELQLANWELEITFGVSSILQPMIWICL